MIDHVAKELVCRQGRERLLPKRLTALIPADSAMLHSGTTCFCSVLHAASNQEQFGRWLFFMPRFLVSLRIIKQIGVETGYPTVHVWNLRPPKSLTYKTSSRKYHLSPTQCHSIFITFIALLKIKD